MGEITYTDHVRDNVGSQASNPEAARLKVYCLTLCDLLDRLTVEVDRLADEVDRLRAESAQAWAINRVVKGTNERLCDEVDRLRADAMAKAHRVGELGREVDRLRTIRDLAAEALAELDAQPDLAHPDAVWYTGAALRDALEADRA